MQKQNLSQDLKIFQSITDIIISEDFRTAQADFFDKNCHIFDSEEENKHEYHQLFKEFGAIIDTSIEAKLLEIYQDNEIQNFFDNFEKNYKTYDNYQTIDTLKMFTDFENFKKVMVDYNNRINKGKMEDQLQENQNVKTEKIDYKFLDFYKNKPISEFKHVIKGKKDGDINVWTIPYENTGVNLMRGTWTFKDVEIESIMEMMLNPDFDKLKKDFKMIKEAKFLEVMSENNKISYLLVDMPMMQKREYVSQVGYIKEGDTHIIIQNSIDHPSQPLNPKIIRAEIHKTIYLKQVPGQRIVKMETIEYSNMKGSIPKMFLNMMISKMAKAGLNSFYKQVQEIQKKRDQQKQKK